MTKHMPQTQDEDPARCLAFRCRLPKYGFDYAKLEGIRTVFKANTADGYPRHKRDSLVMGLQHFSAMIAMGLATALDTDIAGKTGVSKTVLKNSNR